jgi:uncharacterized Zn finger protein
VPAATRKRNAARAQRSSLREGRELQPVEIVTGRKLAKTFWGVAWCDNLERYSDYSNRLPRGRTYLRNGSVIDLRIEPGTVRALVSGSEIYEVEISVTPLAARSWRALCTECAGGIDSLVELLQGQFSKGVMEVLCRARGGMFPDPRQISMSCSCPDWATMCKHVAAVLYGVGVRLDAQPELLFTLRKVDHAELISSSARGIEAAAAGATHDALAGQDLGELFGIELAAEPAESAPPARRRAAQPKQRAATPPKRGAQRPPRAPEPDTSELQLTVTAAELRRRKVPRGVVEGWLREGLLERSDARGVYRWTAACVAMVRAHRAEAAAADPARRRGGR